MWSLPQPMVLQYVVGCQGICNLALWCCSVLYYGVYKIDYRGFVTATLAGSSFGLVLWLGSSIAIQKNERPEVKTLEAKKALNF
ncbi:hypothetical protein HMI55_002104 [Coelomomyces lativittatus]|nr:hypothetical protein HMI55_002104 [Coelomomyces lativittatus]